MLPGKRTSEGAIYVLQGPPPAGTPLVGGIAVSDDGAIYASNASSLPGFPTNTVAPSISGTPVVGQTLTCTPGTWTGTPTPTVTRQWRANGVNIPGATGTTYVVELAYANQNIRCLETATNSVGTASAQSNFLTIFGAPVNTTAPIITGNAEVGSVLTSGTGTWTSTPTATYVYAWFSDGVVIPGQTANTYTTLSGDIGKTITSRVTATNPAGSVQANSQNGILVAALPANPPVNTVAPVISGNTPVGSVLTTTNGTWTGDAPITYTYTWRADNVSIPGATSQTYTTVTGDIGKSIVCRVTAANVAGTANATSNAIVVTGAVFSPASLFASGEQGAWYDPSDLTTMFQDRAGTTPVTADGQTVGLILDKSKGLVLGSEINPNPGPFTTTTGYGGNGSTLTVSGGNITSTNVGSIADLLLDINGLSNGETYDAQITVVTSTGSAVYVSAYSPAPWTNEIEGSKRIPVGQSGTLDIKRAVVSGGSLRFRVRSESSNASFTISAFSVKELAGNHATAPNDASRPLYKTSGGLHWLQFDGVDDSLSIPSPTPMAILGDLSIFVGIGKSVNGNYTWVTAQQGAATYNAYELLNNANSPPNIVTAFGWGADSGFASQESTASTNMTNSQQIYSFTRNAFKPKIRRNAFADPEGTALPATAAGGSPAFSIGGRASSNYFNGKLYPIIVLGRLATTQEITDTETWVAAKTGVTLP